MKLKIFRSSWAKRAYNAFMDMKKKLEGTYMPDKEARNKRVVVALSGGLNSFVTAYLLKIQKYELIGVTVAVSWESYKTDAAQILACQKNQVEVESIKEFCHQLGIPHFTVKASDEFKESVVEKWVAGRITGTKTNPCWDCHELRLRLLYEKMLELEAQGIATGHLAKIFKQDNNQSVYIHTSNDEAHDQSNLLSRLPQEILSSLILPLSDLQQKEINKLGENFGLLPKENALRMHGCFNFKSMGADYLVENVPAKFLKAGDVVGPDSSHLGDHKGITEFQYGEAFTAVSGRSPEPLILAQLSYSDRKIALKPESYFVRQKFFLNSCRISEETPWHEPLKGVVKLSETESSDCWIYPKNVFSAVVETESPLRILEGEILTVYKKKGKNAKVYLTGEVRFIDEETTIVQEGIKREKVDYSTDF